MMKNVIVINKQLERSHGMCLIEKSRVIEPDRFKKLILGRLSDKHYKDAISGCWVWTGYVNSDGFGQATIAKKTLRVHRVSYEIFKGTIPSGIGLGHICKNKACFNPAHLVLKDYIRRVTDLTESERDGKADEEKAYQYALCNRVAKISDEKGKDKLSRKKKASILSEEAVDYIYGFSHYKGSLEFLSLKYNVALTVIYHVKNCGDYDYLRKQNII